jgi:catechol 2,3-dioxygenase-like lactoylglutathione lyase family enzyme
MKIYVTSIMVDSQEKACQFYTEKLGFKVKHDVPVGEYRWLTLVSPESPEGVELLLEPDAHPAAQPFKAAIKADLIPYTSFQIFRFSLKRSNSHTVFFCASFLNSQTRPAAFFYPSTKKHVFQHALNLTIF